MYLLTLNHYKTGEALPLGSTVAEHHVYWPRSVFFKPIYRQHVLPMLVTEHDEFHAYFANKCSRTFQKGAFLCHDCPTKYLEKCGWGCMILTHSICRLPAECPEDCVLRYACLDRNKQMELIWE